MQHQYRLSTGFYQNRVRGGKAHSVRFQPITLILYELFTKSPLLSTVRQGFAIGRDQNISKFSLSKSPLFPKMYINKQLYANC